MPAAPDLAAREPTPRAQILAFCAFLALALVCRAPTFWRSVLDWDESLYLLMAEAWRSGHLPYTTIWDNKPIGIYAIFASALTVAGHQIAAIRAATIIAASLTAFAVFRITYALLPAGHTRLTGAWMAGLAYSVGSLSNDGLAANTEMFMVCFTATAMVVALSEGGAIRIGALTGILSAAAILTKYVAIFEVPALALALFWWQRPEGIWRRFAAACIGGLALPAAIILLYASHGLLGLWWQDSVVANLTRAGAEISPATLHYVLGVQLSRWLPFYITPFIMLGLWRQFGPPRRMLVLLLVWLIGGAIGVAAAKSFYDHYFQQILPVLCVITGCVLSRLAPRLRQAGFFAIISWTGTTACLAIWQITWPVLDGTTMHPDEPAQIARALRQALEPGQTVYVFDAQPIIYFLLDQPPPTRDVLPSTLTTVFLARVAGVDAPQEVARIVAGRPAYIIINRFPTAMPPNKNQAVYNEVQSDLAAHYHRWAMYTTSIIYQLNP